VTSLLAVSVAGDDGESAGDSECGSVKEDITSLNVQ
jgi:hypothetical protein